jgi:hypothetical protein
LSLQIGGLDKIAVNYPDATDSSAHEETSGSRANRAAANNDGAGAEQAPLPGFTDPGEQLLARVLFLERVEHVWALWC